MIPPRKNRKEPREYDLHLYKERHLIECFFNKIKHYRRLFSRFEKLDQRHARLPQLCWRFDLATMKCQHNLVKHDLALLISLSYNKIGEGLLLVR